MKGGLIIFSKYGCTLILWSFRVGLPILILDICEDVSMSVMSTNIYDFSLLLLWIPTPIPPRSQYPGDFHPEHLTPGCCHVTVSLLPSSPYSSNPWSLPTHGVPTSCPQNSGSCTPQPQRQREILSSLEIHFPFCIVSEWQWEHPFFLENFSSHTWGGAPKAVGPWGHLLSPL